MKIINNGTTTSDFIQAEFELRGKNSLSFFQERLTALPQQALLLFTQWHIAEVMTFIKNFVSPGIKMNRHHFPIEEAGICESVLIKEKLRRLPFM